MMGNVNLSNYATDNTLGYFLAGVFGEDTQNKASLRSFLAAYTEGNREYNQNAPYFTRNLTGYRIVDIAALRRIGIMPIAH